jgi:hypothetical protein
MVATGAPSNKEESFTLLDIGGSIAILVAVLLLFGFGPEIDPGMRTQSAIVLILAGLAAIGGPRVLRAFFKE